MEWERRGEHEGGERRREDDDIGSGGGRTEARGMERKQRQTKSNKKTGTGRQVRGTWCVVAEKMATGNTTVQSAEGTMWGEERRGIRWRGNCLWHATLMKGSTPVHISLNGQLHPNKSSCTFSFLLIWYPCIEIHSIHWKTDVNANQIFMQTNKKMYVHLYMCALAAFISVSREAHRGIKNTWGSNWLKLEFLAVILRIRTANKCFIQSQT